MDIGTVLSEHQSLCPPIGGNVVLEAQKRGWIRPFSQGQYIYTRPWTILLRTLQNMILQRAIKDLGFEEWIFPRVIPREAVASFKLTQFAKDLLIQADSEGNTFLDPVQCISLYHYLRDSKLDDEKLPLKIVECLGGWTWRNETEQTLDGPYRAREFARVEHVYIGTPEQVRLTRKTVQTSLISLLTEIGLSWQLVVGNGCMDIPSVIQARTDAKSAEDIPVQDIEIPIRGTLKDDGRRDPDFSRMSHYKLTRDNILYIARNDAFYIDTDEICGCSVEGNHLMKDFGIESSNNQELWSGCCGIGINRLIIGFLYQYGFNTSNWPPLFTGLDC